MADEQQTLNFRNQRTNQKYRNLVGSDQQMQRLEETDFWGHKICHTLTISTACFLYALPWGFVITIRKTVGLLRNV